MVMNRTIQVRMTKDQYERIRQNSQAKGFHSMSSFMRFAALEQDFIVEKKIIEIHNHLFGRQETGKIQQTGVRPRPQQM